MTDPNVDQPRIGYMGLGYMGHGAAKNILAKGYRLSVLGNRNRAPVDDLLARGAREARGPAELARQSDVVFLCLPSSVEVEAAVFGQSGILSEARPGLVLVDSTTADPASTRRIGAAMMDKGASMLDAPLGRTPREAELGTLSTFVGGEPDVIARVRPVIEAFASTVVVTGGLGSGHTMKLLNNFLAIATSAVVGEGLATALRLGIDMQVFKQVVDTGGGNSVMFQRYAHWVLHADDSHFQAQMSIATKDLKYYRKIAEENGCPTTLSDAASQLYQLANLLGHSRQFMPVLPTILANLADGGARPLPAERA
jgi:3-hydroxyisobutyrate dehydrogenase-like beta-hydroxyacid dehydrogenase